MILHRDGKLVCQYKKANLWIAAAERYQHAVGLQNEDASAGEIFEYDPFFREDSRIRPGLAVIFEPWAQVQQTSSSALQPGEVSVDRPSRRLDMGHAAP